MEIIVIVLCLVLGLPLLWLAIRFGFLWSILEVLFAILTSGKGGGSSSSSSSGGSGFGGGRSGGGGSSSSF